MLCDLDAAGPEGSTKSGTDKLGSSAYFSPEKARFWVRQVAFAKKQATEEKGVPPVLVIRHENDTWALGVVIIELCNGRTLFAQDMANDELVDHMHDLTKLCVWRDIPDRELGLVFKDSPSASTAAPLWAQNLIRQCLSIDPASADPILFV